MVEIILSLIFILAIMGYGLIILALRQLENKIKLMKFRYDLSNKRLTKLEKEIGNYTENNIQHCVGKLRRKYNIIV